jgi:riboflavin kinase / FMN adenylyltransferase
MQIFHDLCDFPKIAKPIVTIGTFDGVHIGHQTILKSIVERAKLYGKKSVLFTFHPHPRTILDPKNHQVKMIDSLDEKLEKLQEIGLDVLILFPFTKDFSLYSAFDFTSEILVKKLDAFEIHIGHDHHFGKDRSGDFQQLQEFGNLLDFHVFQTTAISVKNEVISSTKIRRALSEGNIQLANSFLGRPFQLRGNVIHGNKLGRTIGFPTANVEITDTLKIIPSKGVYSARFFVRDAWYFSVLNIGNKPTVQDSDKIYVEAYIFNFSSDIYEEKVKIELYDFLRTEQKFDSLDSLKNQLINDEISAHSLLLARFC